MRWGIIILFSFVALSAKGVDLQGPVPQGWKEIARGSDAQTYARGDEMVVVHRFSAGGGDAAMLENLNPLQLTKVRRPVFEAAGLFCYSVVDIRRLSPLQKNLDSKQLLIEASYRDYAGNAVQVIERQYLVAGVFYAITYRVTAKALQDYDRIRRLMDQFKPVAPSLSGRSVSRQVASELSNPASRDATYGEDKAVGIGGSSTYAEPKMTQAELDKKCKDVPEENRRKVDDPGFESIFSAAVISSGSCLAGVADWAWELAKGIGSLVYSAGRMAFDKDYRSEVTATAGAIATEAYRHPAEFGGRVMTTLYQAVNGYMDGFFTCLSVPAKIEAFCKLAANLIPIGTIAKLMIRAPLTVDEIAKLSEAARIAGKPYLERAVNLRGERAYKVAGEGDDTLSKAARSLDKRGIDVFVSEFDKSSPKRMGYSGSNTDDRPFAAFRKSALVDPEESAGIIGHEATHAVNSKRVIEGQNLGKARSVRLYADKDVKVMKHSGSYSRYMRVDEVQARAVESGVWINRAEKAVAEGRLADARRYLADAQARITEAQLMKKMAQSHMESAQLEMVSGARANRVVYDAEKGRMTVRIPQYAEGQVSRLQKLYKTHPKQALEEDLRTPGIRVQIELEPNLTREAAIARFDQIIVQGRKELNRFDKTFRANQNRLDKLMRDVSPEH